MFIEKITICNMFAYYGKVEVEFKKQEGKNLYCIYGDNGFGKTSFIQCAKILFLGVGLNDDNIPPQIKSFASKISSTKKFIKGDNVSWLGILNNNAYKEDKEDFYVEFSGILENENFKIKRIFKKSDGDFEEIFTFTLGEETFQDKEAQGKLDKIMPPNLVEFFFFNGEQIESISNNLRTEFREKIEEILSIKALELAIKGIEKYKDELIESEYKNKKEALRLSQLKSQKEDIEENIDFTEKAIKNCEDEIEQKIGTITQIQREIDKLDADSSEEKAKLINEKDVFDKDLNTYKDNFKESIKAVIFANNTSLIQELENELSQLENNQSKDDIQSYKKLLPELKKIANDELKSLQINEKYAAIFESILEILPDKLKAKNINNSFITSAMLIPLKENLARYEKTTLSNDISYIKNIKDKLERNRIEREELNDDEYIKNKLDEYENDKKNAQNFKQEKEQERENLKEENREFKSKKEEIEKEIYRLEQNINTERIDDKLYILKLLHACLQSYKKRLIEILRTELKNSILENYKKLIKNDNVQGLDIDDDFAIKLKDKNNEFIAIENQSSGQKQILAMAIFWALSKLSKSNLPLIIDTPLARIDSENRTMIIENYYANASKQVIILPTDTEISQREYEYARKYIAKLYKIENPSDRHHATIKTADISEIL